MKNLNLALIFTVACIGFWGCKKSNFEEIQLKKNPPADTTKNIPNAPTCDTTNVGFAAVIKPLFNTHCNSCHSTSAGTFPALDDYQSSKDNIQTIIDAILQNGNASPMPKGASKLDDCTINKVKAWKNKNFPS
jgi:cytochrome c5